MGVCVACGEFFEDRPTPRKRRFCSNACRQRAYRQRHQEPVDAPPVRVCASRSPQRRKQARVGRIDEYQARRLLDALGVERLATMDQAEQVACGIATRELLRIASAISAGQSVEIPASMYAAIRAIADHDPTPSTPQPAMNRRTRRQAKKRKRR